MGQSKFAGDNRAYPVNVAAELGAAADRGPCCVCEFFNSAKAVAAELGR
jgi:hypothetical protein